MISFFFKKKQLKTEKKKKKLGVWFSVLETSDLKVKIYFFYKDLCREWHDDCL